MMVQEILNAIKAGRVRISDHADEEANADGLAFDRIEESLQGAGIIEDYPTDKPYQVSWCMAGTSVAPPFIVFGRIIGRMDGLF